MGSHFLTLDEASERFGLHPKTIMGLVRSGQLRGYKAKTSGRNSQARLLSMRRGCASPLPSAPKLAL